MLRRVMSLSHTLVRLAVTVVVCGGLYVLFAWLPSGCTPMVNRFAFYPDPGRYLDDSSLPRGVEHVTFPTGDGETIEGYLIPATAHPERLVLYFHGNAGNIAQRLPELREFARHTGAAVLGSGYRGYGLSTGAPSETGIYRDGEAALRYARETLGFPAAQIVIAGRSLGSTVATHLASRGDEFAGVVLITPLSTGRDFGRAHMGPVSVMAGRSFDSLGRAASITEPVLVIHGTNDTVIPYDHGRKVFDALAGPKRFVTIVAGRHNDLEHTDPRGYWSAIAAFSRSPATAVDGASGPPAANP